MMPKDPKVHDPIVRMAVLAYANEPCGVCGKDITEANLLEDQDVVFSGYRDVGGRVSRSSHGPCWRGLSAAERQRLKDTADRGDRPTHPIPGEKP